MKVGKKWKIESDSMNVTLSRLLVVLRGERKGEKYWSVEGYYPTPKLALKGLVDQGVRDTELTDLKTIVKAIDELKSDIGRLEI